MAQTKKFKKRFRVMPKGLIREEHIPTDDNDPQRLELIRISKLRVVDPRRYVIECQRFVTKNIRLAKKYVSDLGPKRVPFDDLFSGACIGLMEAIQEFDPTKASRFSSFAIWKMRHQCQQILDRNEVVVRVPDELMDSHKEAAYEIDRMGLAGAEPDLVVLLDRLRTRERKSIARSVANGDKPRKERWSGEKGQKKLQDCLVYGNPAAVSIDALAERSVRQPIEHDGMAADVRRAYRTLSAEHRSVLAAEFGVGGDAAVADYDEAEHERLLTEATRAIKRELELHFEELKKPLNVRISVKDLLVEMLLSVDAGSGNVSGEFAFELEVEASVAE